MRMQGRKMKLKDLTYNLLAKAGKFIGNKMVYYQAATKYVGLLNFLLILATFKATYELGISIWVIIPLGFLLVMVVGLIDYKFVMKHQLASINKKNNILIELKEVKKMLEEMKVKK